MSLPLELRFQIYRHALLTDQNVKAQSRIYLMCLGIPPAEIKKGFSPSILRVSRAVYEEASTIFYGEKIFQYHCRANDDGALNPFENRCSKRSSAKIKHLEVSCQQRGTKLTAGCVSTMLEHLRNLECSLKTLRLNFVLERTYNRSAGLQEALSISVMYNTFELCRILNSIQALQVRQKIEVHLATEMEVDWMGYEYLVDAIAARMGWKAELRYPEKRPNFIFIGPGASSLPTRHEWSWVLQPKGSVN